jgi:hypothetical protein
MEKLPPSFLIQENSVPSATSISLDPPPQPPRTISPAARRRSWIEPQVRAWWLCALLLLAAVLYLCVSAISDWYGQVQLIRTGTKLQATIIGNSARYDKNFKRLDPLKPVYLQFTLNGQTCPPVSGRIPDQLPPRNPWYAAGDQVPIIVNPRDPSIWTGYDRPPPLAEQLVVAYLALLMATLLGAGAWVRRRLLLAWWRKGEAARAIVIESRQSGSSPRSRLLRCELKSYSHNAVRFEVIYPSATAPAIGQDLWLILPAGTANRALAARLYQD